jgi:uncharacterized protein (TIGR03435 family)
MNLRVLLLLVAGVVYGQEKPARLTFDVFSIKPAKPGGRGDLRGIKPKSAGQGYDAVGATVRLMISLMYRMPMDKVTGGPGWLDTDLWDVEAKADKQYNLDDLHTMFQNLLADEFKLQFHKETKEGPVYVLSVDKGGSKMKVNDSPQDFEIPIKGGPGGIQNGKRVPMEYLCYFLGQVLRNDPRPVLDKTGLTGYYDFTLTFLPDLPPGFDKANIPAELLDRPSIFDALRQQLGLKLEGQKGPVTYYVIDRVEKPAGN